MRAGKSILGTWVVIEPERRKQRMTSIKRAFRGRPGVRKATEGCNTDTTAKKEVKS